VIQGTDLEKDMNQGSAVVNEIIDAVREKVWASTLGDDQVRVSAISEDPSVAFQLANATVETGKSMLIAAIVKPPIGSLAS
jgi:hypothetical protein